MTESTLNPSQLAAVQSNAALTLVVASPGSGKTRVLIARIARLIQIGVRPSEIVAISFSNAAADEINHRLPDGIKLGYSGTLHSFLLRLIQQNYKALGYRKAGVGIIDEEQAEDLLERCCVRVGYKGSKRAVHDALGRKQINPRANPAEIAALAYCMELLSNGLLTFDMILLEGLRLLEMGISLPFTHVFVDEIQDLIDLEYQIIQKLPIANRYLTGDPDQSIFGFKGGNINHILALATV